MSNRASDKDYDTDHMLDTLLHLAYTILDYYKMPVGLQYNVEGYVYGRKIHIMMEVSK